MNICIIGDGLTSLSLAKNLIDKKVNVHIYSEYKNKKLIPGRTIGISKNNLDFFKKEISQIPKKNYWEIKKIEIYSQKLKNENLLNFENKKNNLFYMVKNDQLYDSLRKKVFKNKFFNSTIIKKTFKEEQLNKKEYDLIINCDSNNQLSKKFFFKKISKDYNSHAFTAILEHQTLTNNIAVQIFTKFGPIAYLPISNTKTSVVYSLENKKKEYSQEEVIKLINKHNTKFKIKNISNISSFNLRSSNLRNYYYNKILAFGDLLHRVHPLAGQGFNMTIRDIKILSDIIQDKIDLGLQLDSFVFKDFEKKMKHKNFIFSNIIDLIYEFFNFDKKNDNKNLSKILKMIGKSKNLSNAFIKIADRGLNI